MAEDLENAGTPENTDAPEVETPAVDTPAAETPESEVPTGDSSPDLASGLDIGSESTEEVAEEAPHFEPIIRGKIDRFGVAWGTGRRKTSVARVRIKDGTGNFTVNGRPLKEYFNVERDLGMIFAPLKATGMMGKVDLIATVKGGGPTGQTGAVVLGIARALQAKNPQSHAVLSDGGFLTRDSRMVERKKYGRAGARKSFQFSKR